MANIIYGLVKAEYKEFVKNPFVEFEEALESDGERLNKSDSQNSIFTTVSNERFSNCNKGSRLNSNNDKKQLTIQMNKVEVMQIQTENMPLNFSNIKQRILLHENKRRQTESAIDEEPNMKATKINSSSIITESIGVQSNLLLEQILSQYIPTKDLQVSSNVPITENLSSKSCGNGVYYPNHTVDLNLSQEISQQLSKTIPAKSLGMEVEKELIDDSLFDNEEVFRFKSSLLSSISTLGVGLNNAINESGKSSRKSKESLKKSQKTAKSEKQSPSSKMTGIFVPREKTNNWSILICISSLKEDSHSTSSFATKDILARAEILGEDFTISSFGQIETLISNGLLFMYLSY